MLGWIAIPVMAFGWYSEALHFSMSDAVMNQHLLTAVGAMAGGVTLPWTARPFLAALERRRQREKAREVQQALMWVTKERSMQRDVRIAGLASMKLSISHRKLAERLTFDDESGPPRERVGDPALDGELRVSPEDSNLVLAALTPPVRAALAALLEDCDRLELRDQALTVHTSARRSGEELTLLGTAMIELMQLLQFPTADIPRRLEERFRDDPLPGVRDAALKALLSHHRESTEGRAIAQELLHGDDVRLGLLAAQAMQDEAAIARFEARIEGNRGRISVTDDVREDGRLSLDRRARQGALSSTKK